jgi:hypothetical protein
MREKEIHQAFEMWLRERQVPFITSRMDQKSTIAKGAPDYCVTWMGRCLYIEVKTEKGRLRDNQAKAIDYIRRSGNRVEICRSVSECVEAVQSILCTGEAPSKLGLCNYPLEPCFKALKDAVVKAGTPPEVFDAGMVEEKFGTEAVTPVNGNDVLPGNPRLYLKNWGSVPWVCERRTDGPDLLLHKADAHDLLTVPRE